MPDLGHPSIRVKICGVTRPEDARHAAAAGAVYVGAILSPGFSRSISAEKAGDFGLGGGTVLVGVFVNAGVLDAVRAARTAGAGVLQLHGDERPEDLRALRQEGPWRLWKAVRIQNAAEIMAAADRWLGVADGLMLDGFREGAAGGGHGARFPWNALESVRRQIPAELDLIVAGGLTPESVGTAVLRLSPDVVDVSSGVEAQLGVKDPERVRAFIERARAAALEWQTPPDARVAGAG